MLLHHFILIIFVFYYLKCVESKDKKLIINEVSEEYRKLLKICGLLPKLNSIKKISETKLSNLVNSELAEVIISITVVKTS